MFKAGADAPISTKIDMMVHLIPHVSDEEMKEIEATFSDKDFEDTHFVDALLWLERQSSEKTGFFTSEE